MGVLRRSELGAPVWAEQRMIDVFYGRTAACLDFFREVGNRSPGTSPGAIEEQIFGQARAGAAESKPVRSRYPVVAVKTPLAAIRVRRRLRAVAEPTKVWWRERVAPGALESEPDARAALAEAGERFEAVMRPHMLAAMLCQGLYDQIHLLAEVAGRPGLELSLVTGYGDMAETEVVSDLWRVSRGRLQLSEFVARHGFHGPREGELASRVWRLDPGPLEPLVERYASMPADRDPRAIERARGTERVDAEAELLAALPRTSRPRARLVLSLGGRFIPLRGVGKAAFLRAIDVGRAAARALGAAWAERGLLADSDDVFMFTAAELGAAEPPSRVRELAAERRATHDKYLGLDIPPVFEGEPTPFALATGEGPRERSSDPITGLPVSPGTIEGVARVVEDPAADAIEPGEILVCRTTDPSWASMMMLASALVIDIGGAISHGAIIARELGIPCVIGTRDGTRRIRTGDALRVDGQTGEVTLREPVPG